MTSPVTIAKRLREEHARTGAIAITKSGPWSFGFSLEGKRSPVSIFTAKVHTSTTESDWGFLGQVVAEVGMPKGTPWPKTIETDAEATHYWIWGEKAEQARKASGLKFVDPPRPPNE